MGLDPNSIMYLRLTPVCFKQPHLCTSSIKDFENDSHAFLAAMTTWFWRYESLNLRLNWNTNQHVTQEPRKNITEKKKKKSQETVTPQLRRKKVTPFVEKGK
ncbi:hypothetical protein V8G54_008286, partial [Vigna mungo]